MSKSQNKHVFILLDKLLVKSDRENNQHPYYINEMNKIKQIEVVRACIGRPRRK